MADKQATGNPEDDIVTDSKQREASSKETDSKSEDNASEGVAYKTEKSLPEVTLLKPDTKAVKPPPDIKASKLEAAAPPAKPFEVSTEPCNRITAPPPMKSCSCTPKPSLREAFREALHKLCPKSRSTSKTVVCLDQKKHTDKDTGTQTPPREICLKAKDYTTFDGCQKRSDLSKIDSYPAEELVTKINPDKDSSNKENGSAITKDLCPKDKEVEKNTLEELPPCPYPCAPVDNYEKYDLVAKEQDPQEPAVPVAEDNAAQSTKEPETHPPPHPAKEEKKPIRDHCKKTPPQTEFCGYRKDESK